MAAVWRKVSGLTRLHVNDGQVADRVSARQVQDFLLCLHQQHGLNRSTCSTIRHGLRFFSRTTLGRPDPHFYVPGAKQASRLPQLLHHEERVRLFTATTDLRHRAVLMPAYRVFFGVS